MVKFTLLLLPVIETRPTRAVIFRVSMSRKLVSFAPLMDKYVIRTKSTPVVVEERLLANSEEWKRKLQQRAAAKEAIELARE